MWIMNYRNLRGTDAVKLALPLRRRLRITLRPALVWLRLRKPNLRALRNLDGL